MRIGKPRGQRRRIPALNELGYNATAMTRNPPSRTGGKLLIVLLTSLTLAACGGARQPASSGATDASAAPVPSAALFSMPVPAPTQVAGGSSSPGEGTTGPATAVLLDPTPTQPTWKPVATAIPTRTRTPTPVPRLVPTLPPSRTATVAPLKATSQASRIPAATAAASRPQTLPNTTPGPDRGRVCVDIPLRELADYDWGDALPGFYSNFRVVPNPPRTPGVGFAQLVRTRRNGQIVPSMDVIRAAAERNPGSLWLVGNEPDVALQDNATPEQYARDYGIVYRTIKEADPTARVAIAGVSQPTPLRMAYLDRVLAAYRELYGTEMPVDVWNVHAYILREERGSWGAGIPPGMPVDRGELFEITDHGDMAIFTRQIADFRRWMASHGQRDKPLIVSEYGILMPADYGFPPEKVGRFLVDTFDYFLQARDPETGYPADDNRLVQSFCWFSTADLQFPTSDLFDLNTGTVTEVGKFYRDYVSKLK
jgi:hypothetical protein